MRHALLIALLCPAVIIGVVRAEEEKETSDEADRCRLAEGCDVQEESDVDIVSLLTTRVSLVKRGAAAIAAGTNSSANSSWWPNGFLPHGPLGRESRHEPSSKDPRHNDTEDLFEMVDVPPRQTKGAMMMPQDSDDFPQYHGSVLCPVIMALLIVAFFGTVSWWGTAMWSAIDDHGECHDDSNWSAATTARSRDFGYMPDARRGSPLETGSTMSGTHSSRHSDADLTLKSNRSEATKEMCAGYTKWQAVVIICNSTIGIGCLAIPYCVFRAGIIAFPLLAAAGVLTGFTGILLGESLSHLREFPDSAAIPVAQHDWFLVGRMAFGEVGARVLSVIVGIDYVCSLVGQLLIVRAEAHINGLIMIAVAVALCYVPLHRIPWISKLGVLLQALSCSFLLITAIAILAVDCRYFGKDVSPVGMGHHGPFDRITSVIGIFVGVFCVHTVMPVVYQNLQHKHQWPAVVRTSFTVLGGLYTVIGLVGYCVFGHRIKQVYTKNLGHDTFGAPIPGLSWLAPASGLMIMLQTLTCVPAVARSLLGMVETRVDMGMMGGAAFRIAIISVAVLIAVTEQKFFAYMVAFRGAFVDAQVCIGLPILAYLVLLKHKTTLALRCLVSMAFVMGYIAMSFGTVRDIRIILGIDVLKTIAQST
eukprot:gnl/TRDRNA2_/TRDRNA2_85929_c0_seq1.p1 gnl/TRDRNA2_/TRDRNA2_85929_c0~~gnl/TRDRNA2_/TRDRNA2_85929_c0_seq1.p1  ORF type:complete len:646 (+),score=76.89 gnl/TRDRNA2_/TRDRNA2_85929_c0_seq1:51-1988(+)